MFCNKYNAKCLLIPPISFQCHTNFQQKINVFSGFVFGHVFSTCWSEPQMAPKIKPLGSQIRPTTFQQKNNCSQPCGVGESVFEATLRRTTLQTDAYKLFYLLNNSRPCVGGFCTILLDWETIRVVCCIDFTTPTPNPHTKQSANTRPGGMCVSDPPPPSVG